MLPQKPKPIYRVYVAAIYGETPEWELNSPWEALEKAWTALEAFQKYKGAVWPVRIVSAVPFAGEEDDFDMYDGGDETFIDEKGCGLAELARLISIGEVKV